MKMQNINPLGKSKPWANRKMTKKKNDEQIAKIPFFLKWKLEKRMITQKWKRTKQEYYDKWKVSILYLNIHRKKRAKNSPQNSSLPAYKSRQPNLKSKFIVNAYSKNNTITKQQQWSNNYSWYGRMACGWLRLTNAI